MNQSRLLTCTLIAGTVSVVVIIVAVSYAAYEFRQSHTLCGREVNVLLYDRLDEINRMLVQTPDLADIYIAAEESPDKLTRAEWLRYETFERMWFNAWNMGWHHFHADCLNEKTWLEWDDHFRRRAQTKDPVVWNNIRESFGKDFRTHVDEAMGLRVPDASLPAAPDPAD